MWKSRHIFRNYVFIALLIRGPKPRDVFSPSTRCDALYSSPLTTNGLQSCASRLPPPAAAAGCRLFQGLAPRAPRKRERGTERRSGTAFAFGVWISALRAGAGEGVFSRRRRKIPSVASVKSTSSPYHSWLSTTHSRHHFLPFATQVEI